MSSSRQYLETILISSKVLRLGIQKTSYNESDKHLTIYNSYNAKCGARLRKPVEFANISEAYSTTNIENSTFQTTHTNFYCTSSLLPGTATAAQ